MAPYGADPVNGVLVSAVAAAAAVARTGPSVEFWLPHPWPGEKFEEHVLALDAAGVTRVVLDTVEPARPWLRRAGVGRARERRVDLIHLHSAFSPHIIQIVQSARVPYVVSPHGGYAPEALRRSRVRKALWATAFERRMLRRAAAVCALTEPEARQVHRFAGPVPVAIVPNGVPPAPAVNRAAFRKELGLGHGVPLALFTGRLDILHKGLDVLIDALAGAPGWHVAFVGPDHRGGRAALVEQARLRGVAGRLHWCGSRYSIALHEAFAAADVFVLPSRWEGLPLALLEALGHGTPAVVSPAVEDAVGVAAAGAGWVASGPLALGQTLAAVASFPAQERRRAETAAAQLARRYQWEKAAEDLLAVYRRAVGRSA